MYVYRNSRTGQIAEFPARMPRLDALEVWLLIASPSTPAAADGRGDEPPVARPAESDPKAAWVAYAVACGMDAADAQALTKAALMEEFGRDAEPEGDAHDPT